MGESEKWETRQGLEEGAAAEVWEGGLSLGREGRLSVELLCILR